MQDIEFQQIQITPAFKSTAFQASLNETESKTLSKTIIQKDIEMVANQILQLKKFTQGVSSVLKKLHNSKHQCSQSIDSLKKESSQLEEKIANYQKSLNQNTVKLVQDEIKSNKKNYIALWEERISIAEHLKIEPLEKIEIEDRKSIANELFKWIVVVIYGENENKFYLPNFKTQIFEKDGGKDFRERLGKCNASSAREQQVIKAKDFLQKYAEIIECEELQSVKTEAQSFRKIAQIFIECNELAKKSSELQKSIEHGKETSLQKDEQALKWKARHEALSQRVEVLTQYLNTLKSTENQLKDQEKSYKNKSIILEVIMSKLKKGEPLSEKELNTLAQA